MSDPAPLILTLALDEASFAFFDDQRRRFFPPERNFIPAHLTLFHALPGTEMETIAADLERICRDCPAFSIAVTGLRSLGRGVAYVVQSPELSELRGHLAQLWGAWLTPQDRHKLQPHVTVQNKVAPDEAKALLRELQSEFAPFTATADGLLLWRYRGGPWEPVSRFHFAAASPPAWNTR
jgi:2'-5' RNA ligase